MMEVSSSSLKNESMVIHKIHLAEDSSQIKNNWITMGSGAGINKDALIDPALALSSLQVVGCLSGFSSNPINFVKKYPFQPTIAFNSLDELKRHHQPDSKLFWYYPTVPSKKRDQTSLDLIKHFPNSLLLLEKPSHNTAAEAKAFK